MSNPHIGDSWQEHRKEMFTPEEIALANAEVEAEIRMIQAAERAQEERLISQSEADVFHKVFDIFISHGLIAPNAVMP